MKRVIALMIGVGLMCGLYRRACAEEKETTWTLSAGVGKKAQKVQINAAHLTFPYGEYDCEVSSVVEDKDPTFGVLVSRTLTCRKVVDERFLNWFDGASVSKYYADVADVRMVEAVCVKGKPSKETGRMMVGDVVLGLTCSN